MIEKTQNKSSNTSGAPPKAAFDFEDIMAGMAKKLMVSEKFVPSEFKVISAFTEEVDLDKVEVITAKDGVVYFKYDNEKYQISSVSIIVHGAPAIEHKYYINGMEEKLAKALSGVQSVPKTGEALIELLEVLLATKGTVAERSIKDSLKSPNQQLLMPADATQEKARTDYVAVSTQTVGIANVTLKNGGILVVSKELTPQAYLDYTRPPNQADYLSNPGARDDSGKLIYLGGSNGAEYQLVNQMPAIMNAKDLRIVAKNPEMGMIYFEYAGEKFKIQAGKAQEFSRLDDQKDPQQNSALGVNVGIQLYTFLNLLYENKGTPVGAVLREAQNPGSGSTLLRADEVFAQAVSQIELNDGFLTLKIENGIKLIVHSQLTPEAYNHYKGIASQHDAVEEVEIVKSSLEKDGFVQASNDYYVSDTKNVKAISGESIIGPRANGDPQGLKFFYQEPGGAEQKLYVTKDSNPQLYKQILSLSVTYAEQVTISGREKAGLRSFKELSVEQLPTSEKNSDGDPLTVGDLAFKNMIESYRSGIGDGSIGKDDVRAQFIRVFDAKGMSINGMEIVPEHAADKRIGQPTHVTGTDVNEEIFDQKKIDTRLNDLFGDDKIKADMVSHHDKAILKVEGGETKVKETEKMLIDGASSEAYVKYLDDLSRSGYAVLAKHDVQATYALIAAIDPEKAEVFRVELEANGLVVELERIMSEPGAISDESMGLAAEDITKAALAAGKAWGDGIPRRGFGIWKETLTEIVNNMSSEHAPSWGAVIKEVGDTWAKEGKLDDAKIQTIIKKRITPDMGMPSPEKLFTALKFMKDNGVLGTIGGTFSLISAVYQLNGGGGGLGASHRERMSVAAGFMGTLSGSNHLHTLGVSVYDALSGSGLMAELGTDRPIQAVWSTGEKAEKTRELEFTKNLHDKWTKESITGALTTQGVKAFTDDDRFRIEDAMWDSIAKRGGVSDSNIKKVMGSVPRVLGGIGDVGGGVLGVTLGAMGIQAGLKNNDSLAVAAGALDILGGVGGLVGGGATFAEILGKGGRVVAWAGPIGFGIAAVASFITAMISVAEDGKLKRASVQNYRDIYQMKEDGLLTEKGDENYVWLQTYLHSYNQRDTPADQSVFDYRREEFENGVLPFEKGDRVEHLDYAGDDFNRFHKHGANGGNIKGNTLNMIDDQGNIVEYKSTYKSGWKPA